MPHRTSSQQAQRRNWRTWLALIAVLIIIALNGLAFMHARAAMHFVPSGQTSNARDLISAPLPQKLQALIGGVRIPRPENRTTPADHNLLFTVQSIPLPDNEQLEAWHVPHPQPRGIVLMFPGYGGVKDGLLTPAAYLYQFGYSSLLIDFRGSGGSSRNDTTLGMREADDVTTAFRYAQQQWPEQPIILYGVSMGSAAILRAVALDRITPTALILEGPFDRLMTTVRHRFTAAGAPSFPAADLLVLWGSVQVGYNGFAHNPVDYAGSVTCPTLMLHGERDPWIMAEEIQAIAQQLRGPTQVMSVPNQGHAMPFVYGAPELWVASVGQFVDGLE